MKTIITTPRAELRHFTVDGAGNLYVLGMDPDYFNGKPTCVCWFTNTPRTGSDKRRFPPVPQGYRCARRGERNLEPITPN